MIEETRRPNPKSRSERTRRRLRLLNGSKDGKTVSPLSISPPKTLVQLENQRNNNMLDTAATLPQRKTKTKSLTRFLSFRKKKKRNSGSEDFSPSDDSFVATDGAENFKISPNLLHNELQSPSVIELENESKLAVPHVPEDDSTDSFKSAGLPELRNRVEDTAVDKQPDAETTLTESAFSVFANSDLLQELEKMENLLKTEVSVKKVRARGRGASKPDSEPASPEETVKISGDALRKQLSDGLKIGAGKSKEVKSKLVEITQNAVVTSVEETLNFFDSVKQEETKNEETKDPLPSTSFTDPEQLGLPPAENKKEHLYKILVIGELGTGKTSIIKRYVHQFFSQHYRATIGVDFALKVLNWDENSIIRLQLWDIAGQERFGNMTRVYYKEAVGAFIVFDVTRAATFDAVQKWKQDLDSKVQLSDGSPIPCVLLANKCDQPKEGVVNNKNKMDEYCKENGFAGWFETSAKENINIEDAARSLVLKILQNDQLIRTGDRGHESDKIALDGTSESQTNRVCSC